MQIDKIRAALMQLHSYKNGKTVVLYRSIPIRVESVVTHGDDFRVGCVPVKGDQFFVSKKLVDIVPFVEAMTIESVQIGCTYRSVHTLYSTRRTTKGEPDVATVWSTDEIPQYLLMSIDMSPVVMGIRFTVMASNSSDSIILLPDRNGAIFSRKSKKRAGMYCQSFSKYLKHQKYRVVTHSCDNKYHAFSYELVPII